MLALSLLACRPHRPAELEPHASLEPFRDNRGGDCVMAPTAAYGGPFSGFWVGAIAADAHHLYVSRSTGNPPSVWLTVLDPRDGGEVGRVELPTTTPLGFAQVVGDLLVLVLSNRDQTVLVVDVTDPAAPTVLQGRVDLGRGPDPTAFSVRGGLAFTDGGTTNALDLADPRNPDTVGYDQPFGAPLVVGDELLSAEPVGRDCVVRVWDLAASPPAAGAAVDTGGVCLGAGIVATDGGALGVGWTDQTPVAVALTRGDDGWTSAKPVPVDIDQPDQVLAVDGGAFVLGSRSALVDPSGETLATWAPGAGLGNDTPPTGSMFWGPAAAIGSTVWLGASAESGSFEGIVALDAEGCR